MTRPALLSHALPLTVRAGNTGVMETACAAVPWEAGYKLQRL